jgi:hypothetical protein
MIGGSLENILFLNYTDLELKDLLDVISWEIICPSIFLTLDSSFCDEFIV